jgi:hypothetical protein
MKKLFILLLFLSVTLTYSQSDLNIGFTVGGSFGDFRGNSIPENIKSQLAPIFGVEVQQSLSSNIYLRSGLNYGKNKVQFESFPIAPNDFDLFESQEVPIAISVFTVPLYVGYRSNGEFRFTANTGAFISFISDEENIIVGDIDYGLGASLGVEYSVSKNGFLRLELHNELGLKDINDSMISLEDNTIKTNRIGIYITYLIQL